MEASNNAIGFTEPPSDDNQESSRRLDVTSRRKENASRHEREELSVKLETTKSIVLDKSAQIDELREEKRQLMRIIENFSLASERSPSHDYEPQPKRRRHFQQPKRPMQCVACGLFDIHRNIHKHFPSHHCNEYVGRKWILTDQPQDTLPECERALLPDLDVLMKWRKVNWTFLGIERPPGYLEVPMDINAGLFELYANKRDRALSQVSETSGVTTDVLSPKKHYKQLNTLNSTVDTVENAADFNLEVTQQTVEQDARLPKDASTGHDVESGV